MYTYENAADTWTTWDLTNHTSSSPGTQLDCISLSSQVGMAILLSLGHKN